MRSMTPMRHPSAALAFGLLFAFAPGCDQPTGKARTPVASTPVDPPAEPAAPSPPPLKPILGEKTQDIRDAAAETKAGGHEVGTKITAKDPIRLVGNAYVTSIGRVAQLQIEASVKLYQGETGEYPKTLDEFMEKIIRANNINLPKLPAYQEYGYDVPSHSLKIMEYEDRKKAMNYPK